jgi:hypothetical protein
MTAQHTPGPWKMGFNFTNEQAIIGKDGVVVADASWTGGSGCELSIDNPADAKLIAAAPDLLTELRKARAALKEQLEILIQSHTCPTTGLITDDTALLVIESDQDLINSIDAAIAKAKGAA